MLEEYRLVTEECLNIKDREIARLKAELAEAGEKLKAHEDGRNLVVSPEFLDAKDQKIRELEFSLYRAESGGLRKDNDALKANNEKIEKEIVRLRELIAADEGRDDWLRGRLNEVKAENKALKRLMNDRGTYDQSMVESFDERTAEELAKFVEFELANGGKTTFAAACLVLMWLKHEQQKAANQFTIECIAATAAALDRLHEEIAAG